jgi:hypothetical protein
MDIPDSPHLLSIRASLDSLRKIAMTSPDMSRRITRDLETLFQRYTSQLQQLSSPPHESNTSALSPSGNFDDRKDFTKYKNTRVWRELSSRMGKQLRIPDVRKVADSLSRARNVELTPEVRNHADSLIGWFEQHWEAIAPGLPSAPNCPIHV